MAWNSGLTRTAAYSNTANSYWKSIRIPEDAPHGSAIVSASLLSFIGADNSPSVSNFNVTVEFGDTLSEVFKTGSL